MDYENALTKYFELKNEYQYKYEKKKKKILVSSLTLKEKRKAVQNIKMNCIKCQRPVGTIFEDKDRTYTVVCGDKENPCSLHIEIKKTTTNNLNYFLPILEEELEKNKYDFIKTKLSLLFGFLKVDELEKIYQNMMEEYNSNEKIYQLLQSIYDKNVNKTENIEKIKKLNYELIGYINDIKAIIQKYRETENKSLIKDAVELYINDIRKNLDLLRENKYKNIMFDFDYKEYKLNLIQQKYTIEDLEIVNQEGEVVSFSL